MDQAEAMMKALKTMRNKLDAFEEVEFEAVVIDAKTYNISETMINWMQIIYKAKDKNKKRERRKKID